MKKIVALITFLTTSLTAQQNYIPAKLKELCRQSNNETKFYHCSALRKQLLQETDSDTAFNWRRFAYHLVHLGDAHKIDPEAVVDIMDEVFKARNKHYEESEALNNTSEGCPFSPELDALCRGDDSDHCYTLKKLFFCVKPTTVSQKSYCKQINGSVAHLFSHHIRAKAKEVNKSDEEIVHIIDEALIVRDGYHRGNKHSSDKKYDAPAHFLPLKLQKLCPSYNHGYHCNELRRLFFCVASLSPCQEDCCKDSLMVAYLDHINKFNKNIAYHINHIIEKNSAAGDEDSQDKASLIQKAIIVANEHRFK